MKKWKKQKHIYLFFYLCNCFKIMSVYKSEETSENHRFVLNMFFEDGHKS